MITKKEILELAQLKNAAQTEIVKLCDSIPEALKKFDGKSITGNKKRISDTLILLNGQLSVNIENKGYFGTKLKVAFWPCNRCITTQNGTFYIKSDFYVIWMNAKDNMLHIGDVVEDLKRTKECYTRYIKETEETAKNIEQIQQQVEYLKSELSKIRTNSDTELTELFGISF